MSLLPNWAKKYLNIYKEFGFKGILTKTPIWVLVLFFLFFLIKGLLFYVLIPYLIAKGLLK